MQQISRWATMPKCVFNKVDLTLWHGCFPANLLYIFKTHFLKVACVVEIKLFFYGLIFL